jgi:hypothetical protein
MHMITMTRSQQISTEKSRCLHRTVGRISLIRHPAAKYSTRSRHLHMIDLELLRHTPRHKQLPREAYGLTATICKISLATCQQAAKSIHHLLELRMY